MDHGYKMQDRQFQKWLDQVQDQSCVVCDKTPADGFYRLMPMNAEALRLHPGQFVYLPLCADCLSKHKDHPLGMDRLLENSLLQATATRN